MSDPETVGGSAGDAIRYRRVQYETAGLDIDDVDPDPIVQWQRWHADAFEAGVAEPNAVALGTVAADGTPDAGSCSCAAPTRAASRSSPPTTRASRAGSSKPSVRHLRCSAGSTCTDRFASAVASSGSTPPRATPTS